MKYSLSLLVIVLLSLNVPGQQPVVQQQQNKTSDSISCVKYFKIWKDLFMKKNGMSEEYFNKHILVTSTEMHNWKDGESFNVGYDIVIDWMARKWIDQFIVKIDAREFPTLKVPRGVYLSEPEIEEVVSRGDFGSRITTISPVEHLKYATSEAALEDAAKKAGGLKATGSGEYWFYESKYDFVPNGHPYLWIYYDIDRKENKCLSQTLDLVTGESTTQETYCWVE